MHTQCNPQQLEFAGVERRRVVAAFDGGTVSSDGGALLLARTDEAIGLIDRLAQCFRDHRVADLVEHSVRTLVGQRVLGIATSNRGPEPLADCVRALEARAENIGAAGLDPVFGYGLIRPLSADNPASG